MMRRSELKRKTPMNRSAISANLTAKLRARKCKTCLKSFSPEREKQIVCSDLCAELHGKVQTEKQERKADKARKEKLNNHTYYLDLTQAVINRYVNIRDRGKPCISCGKPDQGVRNASHYKARGSNSALRYNLFNISSSCYRCNVPLSGNIAGYIPGLKAKYGAERLEWLDNHPRSREYSREYLERMREIFTKKAKRLIKRMED